MSADAERLLGVVAGDVVGEAAESFISFSPQTQVGSARRRDGSTFAAHLTVMELGTGKDGFFLVSVRDATTFHRQERSSNDVARSDRAKRLLEDVRVIPWEADVETVQFTYVGPQAERILGYPVDEWYGRDFWPQHIHPEDRQSAIETCLRAAERKEHYSFDYRMLAADGRVVWIHDIVAVERVNDVPRLLTGYMVDVTERVTLEQERRRLDGELHAALSALSVASHELRGPLSNLQLLVENVLSRTRVSQGSAPEEEIIARATREITRLMDNLLDVSQISAGRLHLDPQDLDLVSVAREVIAQFELQHSASTIRLIADGAVRGMWDRVRLEQIIRNLVSNAVKYGRGAVIEVSVEATDAMAQIAVRDHGIGIVPEDQLRIFERFERTAEGSQTSRGVGLGLWIVRQIANSMGGTIRVSSALGVGSTFTVELPR